MKRWLQGVQRLWTPAHKQLSGSGLCHRLPNEQGQVRWNRVKAQIESSAEWR